MAQHHAALQHLTLRSSPPPPFRPPNALPFTIVRKDGAGIGTPTDRTETAALSTDALDGHERSPRTAFELVQPRAPFGLPYHRRIYGPAVVAMPPDRIETDRLGTCEVDKGGLVQVNTSSSPPLTTAKPLPEDRKDSATVSKHALTTTSPSTSTLPKVSQAPTPLFQLPDSLSPSTPRYSGPKRLHKHASQHPNSTNKKNHTLHQLLKSTCEASCAPILRRGVAVNSGLDLLLAEPTVVDFLLLCVGSLEELWTYRKTRKRSTNSGLRLLPGECPVKRCILRRVVDAMDLGPLFALDARRGGEDGGVSPTSEETARPAESFPTAQHFLATLPLTQRALLTYILLSPFAHLSLLPHNSMCHPGPLEAPRIHFSFPTIPCTPFLPATFLVTRQPPHKESLFATHCRRPAHTRLTVFHGTHPSRLPLILSQGLRNMSGTLYQAHGRSSGKGIYLARDSTTSLCYSHEVQAWRGSRWRESGEGDAEEGVKVLLGCEVVVEEEKGEDAVFVVRDAGMFGFFFCVWRGFLGW